MLENRDSYPYFTDEEKLAQSVNSLLKVTHQTNGRAEIPVQVCLTQSSFYGISCLNNGLQHLLKQSEVLSYQHSQI